MFVGGADYSIHIRMLFVLTIVVVVVAIGGGVLQVIWLIGKEVFLATQR